jgi:hypothetical protein
MKVFFLAIFGLVGVNCSFLEALKLEQTAQADSRPAPSRLPYGTHVMVTHPDRADLESKKGFIKAYSEEESKYTVRLLEGSKEFLIPGTQLIQMIDVTFTKGSRQREGIVFSFQEEEMEYVIQTDDGKLNFVNIKDIKLPIDSLVWLAGLTTSSDWNGKYGRLIRYEDEGRCVVKVGSQWFSVPLEYIRF